MKKLILTAILLIITAKIYGQKQFIDINDKEKYLYAIHFTNSTYTAWGDDDFCYNYVALTAVHPDDSKTVLYTSSVYPISSFNGYYFVSKTIKYLHIYAESRDEREGPFSDPCDEVVKLDKNISDIVYCSSKYFEAQANHGGGEVWNKITFTYSILPLHFLQSESNNTFLPTDDRVTLYDKADFTSYYIIINIILMETGII
jgi:hypothetical protein